MLFEKLLSIIIDKFENLSWSIEVLNQSLIRHMEENVRSHVVELVSMVNANLKSKINFVVYYFF